MRLLTIALLAAVAAPALAEDDSDAYRFSFISIDGQTLPLSSFKGKSVLVVNTASQCGFTPQYTQLEEIWQKYKDKGFVVLGVPSNDFGGQEPGSDKEIKKFCEGNYDVDFPLTTKYDVMGPKAHPFYQWAAATAGDVAVPKWNFHKLLIDPNGKLVAEFPSGTKPDSPEITKAIEASLPAKG